ncbi:MAG TPA: M20/M25/M40 family metallo-hydrolase [Anaerolineae bacterium]|nr:M20/M25/M40 family metallo-hydrolase [Anaerolineae bacterium]HOG46338.1 M20/M25/M40 family metallo-hydrolase [Anaerolineae bacterium]
MPEPINWPAAVDETVRNLARLIQIDTTNPPGNELPAILAIRELLVASGFPERDITIIEAGANRANLVARLRGSGAARPLLLTGHVDVVPAEREHWSHDPFGGEVAEGCIWGRGALDMKGTAAMYLEAFLLAFRQELPLKRDLILAAIADEEMGFDAGSKLLVDHYRDLIAAEYALNESGGTTVPMGGVRLYPIQVAEKGVCWLRMTAHGTAGHGSMPREDNAVGRLAQALGRLQRAAHLPVHVTPTVRTMLAALSAQLSFPARALVGLLGSPAVASLALGALHGQARSLFTALLTNSVSPTVLAAGSKTNVIPAQASADLDCRLLPGQTPENAMREILAITGIAITLEPLQTTEGAEFPTDTPLYHLLERATRRMDPSGLVVPLLSPGASDAAEYRRAGITVYGFAPGIMPPGFPILELAHGHDERLPLAALETGLPALWEVVSEFCL